MALRPDGKTTFSAHQLSKFLGIGHKEICRAMAEGHLRGYWVNTHRRFSRQEVERFCAKYNIPFPKE